MGFCFVLSYFGSVTESGEKFWSWGEGVRRRFFASAGKPLYVKPSAIKSIATIAIKSIATIAVKIIAQKTDCKGLQSVFSHMLTYPLEPAL